MEKQELISKFIEKVKIESGNKKFVKPDLIKKLVTAYKDVDYTQTIKYKNELGICIELALDFYREYNYDYYLIIINGLLNHEIQYIDYNDISFVDTENNVACIKRLWNDCDVFVMVHEFAHFIDRKSKPNIIPDKYNFLAEVYSRYIERRLMEYLIKNGFGELVELRMKEILKNDALMLRAIDYQLYCEELYKQGKFNENELDIEKVKLIMSYTQNDFINYYLRYPVGTLLSDYLINNNAIKSDKSFTEQCLETNLYDISSDFARKLNNELN